MARTKYISVSQASGLARVDRRTVIYWCRDGKFDCSKIGATWIINERSFLEFLSAKLAFK